jgi:hypothetical protein
VPRPRYALCVLCGNFRVGVVLFSSEFFLSGFGFAAQCPPIVIFPRLRILNLIGIVYTGFEAQDIESVHGMVEAFEVQLL